MCGIDICRGEAQFVEQRPELAAVRQCCRLPKNHAVMRLPQAGEQGHERKYTRICGATERKRSQRVGAPSKAAHDVTGIALDGNEGSVNRCASYRVIDDVEALTFGMNGDILLRGKGTVVDGGCAQLFDDMLLAGRNSGEDLRTKSLCKLHSDVPDSAGACVDQHLLALMHFGTIDDAFPSRDGDQRKSRSLPHRE